MAALDDVYAKIRAADAAGDTATVQELSKVATYLMTQSKPAHNPVADMPSMDPSAGGSTLNIAGFDTGIKTPEVVDRTLSGMGQAVANTGRGIGQMLGLQSRADVAEARKRDAPLDATTAGTVGNFIGNAGMMVLPALGGSAAAGGFLAQTGINAASGAALGLAQPSTSTGETAKNMALGAVGGGLTPAIGKAAQTVFNYGKGFVAPLFKSGQEGIAGRALLSAAGTPQEAQAAARAMQSATPAIPGVQPTMGMVAGNGGLAQLQRAVANNPEAATAFASRDQGNTNALLEALQKIAGDKGQRDFFAADRSAAADALYGKARASYDPANVTPEVQAQIESLLKRPSITEGSKAAQKIAQERGQLPDPDGSLGALHDVKTALDDQISALKTAGKTKEAASVLGTQNKLLEVLDSLSPDYAAARSTFAEMSKPINRMDVGQSVLDKLSPALNEFSVQKQLRPTAFADAIAAGDATARKATGFAGAKMDAIMTPEDLATFQGVGKTLGQIRDAQTMGKAVGSNTAQNQISQDALRQIAGPLGLPKGFSENALMQTLMRPQQFVGKLAEPKITELLRQAALDPKQGAGLMLQQLQKTDDPRLRNALARLLLVGGRTEAASLSQ